MGNVDWSGFSWEAFATIFTGISAVGGALWIGNKQANIVGRQNEISKQNAKDSNLIKQQELQLFLLERRSNCIKTMKELNLSWTKKGQFEPTDWAKLDSVLSEAQLIYPKSTASKIEKIRSASIQSYSKNQRSQTYFSRGNEAKGGEFLEKSFKHDDEVMDIMPSLLEELVDCTRISSEWILQSK